MPRMRADNEHRTVSSSTRSSTCATKRRTTVVVALSQLLVVVVAAVVWTVDVVDAYPVIVQVDEGSQRCFRFNIPEDDDAHMVAVTLPSEDDTDEAMEKWYVDQIYELTKQKEQHKVLPKALIQDSPSPIKERESEFLKQQSGQGNDARVKFQVTGTPASDPTNYAHTYNTRFFQFNVINYVGRSTLARMKQYRKGDTNVVNLEGYGVCLTNEHESRPVQVVLDVVLISEVIVNDDDEGGGFKKDQHLTPLERSLEQSIDAANTVLREMSYMEKREQRMRQTAESINSRVRWFSYLSISVLLSVTYIQVTYLKRYFHKKKLM